MRLGLVIRKYRRGEEISVREMASQIGINFVTLSRLENGERIDGVNLMKIFNWLVECPPLESEKSA